MTITTNGELRAAIRDGFTRLLFPSIENEVRGAVAEWAEGEAVEVFATNLRNRLLQAAYGRRAVVASPRHFILGCARRRRLREPHGGPCRRARLGGDERDGLLRNRHPGRRPPGHSL